MSYPQKELDRLVELYHLIENAKEHEYAAPTYKDSPYLTEMSKIVLSHPETDTETLKESITVLWYLTDCYDKMCRAGMSVKYYAHLLKAYVQLMRQNQFEENDKEEFESCFYLSIKARNRYETDECEDLIEIVTGSLTKDKINELFESAQQDRSTIKYDSIEKTEKYLAVIDEVEEKIDKNKTINFCLENWNLKQKYLAEYGIKWRSPAQLNPKVLFD